MQMQQEWIEGAKSRFMDPAYFAILSFVAAEEYRIIPFSKFCGILLPFFLPAYPILGHVCRPGSPF